MKKKNAVLSFLLLTSYMIQPVLGLDANFTTDPPTIDGVFSPNEWSSAVVEKRNLHFTWFGGEFDVDSNWYSLWDGDTIYLAILYERRPDVEKLHEIIEIGVDGNNNGVLEDGEIGFGAQYTDEGAGSPNVHHVEYFGACEIRVPDSLGWEQLENTNFGHGSLKKSETHVVFEIAISKEIFEVKDTFSFRYRINSYMYGETAKIYDRITFPESEISFNINIENLYTPNNIGNFYTQMMLKRAGIWAYIEVKIIGVNNIKHVFLESDDLLNKITLDYKSNNIYHAQVQLMDISEQEVFDLFWNIGSIFASFIVPGIGMLAPSPFTSMPPQFNRYLNRVIIVFEDDTHYEKSINIRLPTYVDEIWEQQYGIDASWLYDTNGNFITTYSPIKILAIDTSGRRVGSYISNNGIFVEVIEIPDAFYFVYNNSHEVMYLPNADETYTLKINGIEDDEYSIIMTSIQNEEKSAYNFTDEISKDDELNIKISLVDNEIQVEQILATEPEPEPELQNEKKGIPGFPTLAITFGIIISLLILEKVQI